MANGMTRPSRRALRSSRCLADQRHDAVKVLIGGGALTLSATLTVTTSLDMTGGSLVGAGTLTTAQRTGESVKRLVRLTATALDNVLPHGMALVTSGFALRVEGSSQKTVRDWTLRSEGACDWTIVTSWLARSCCRASCLQRQVGFHFIGSVVHLLISSRCEARLVPH